MTRVRKGDDNSMPRYADWNAALRSSIVSFASQYADATVLLFSSHATLTRILDNPVEHGFHEANAASKAGKGIWMDHLHPTGKVHDIVAKDLTAFLGTVARLDGEATF